MPIVDCNCSNTSLPATGAARCGENFGQMQILAFEKKSDAQSGLSVLTAIKTKSNWTDGMTAAKVQLTPEIKGWEQSGGDAVNWGEDVDPLGMPMKVRDNPVQITVTFRGTKEAVMNKIEEMRCLAQMKDLGMYIFPTTNKVLGVDNTTTLDSFSVDYISVNPRVIGVRDEPDASSVVMYIPADEWRKMKAVELLGTGEGTTPDTTTPWRGIDLLPVTIS